MIITEMSLNVIIFDIFFLCLRSRERVEDAAEAAEDVVAADGGDGHDDDGDHAPGSCGA